MRRGAGELVSRKRKQNVVKIWSEFEHLYIWNLHATHINHSTNTAVSRNSTEAHTKKKQAKSTTSSNVVLLQCAGKYSAYIEMWTGVRDRKRKLCVKALTNKMKIGKFADPWNPGQTVYFNTHILYWYVWGASYLSKRISIKYKSDLPSFYVPLRHIRTRSVVVGYEFIYYK